MVKNLVARQYFVNSIYGNVQFAMDNFQYTEIIDNPKGSVENIIGFCFSFSNTRSSTSGEDITDDGGVIFNGIPLGMSKGDIIKIVEMQRLDNIAKKISSDVHVNIKEVNGKISDGFIEQLKKIKT